MKKISLAGGGPITICEASRRPGASWGADDTIIYPESHAGGLIMVSASGGEPETLTTIAPGESAHRWPQHLPDGKSILFSIRTESGTRVVIESLRTGERTTLFDETSKVTQALYLQSGHLVYDQPGNLLVSAFDVDALEAIGPPASALDGAHTAGAGGLTHMAVSGAGDVVYLTSSATYAMASLRELTEDGGWLVLTEARRRYGFLAVDPDGRRIALNITNDDGVGEIWLYDIVRSSLAPLSREGASYSRPVWTPDGRRVTFARSQGGFPNLYWTPADGSGNATELLEGGVARFPSSWTPDESALVWGNFRGIEVLRTDGGSEPYMMTGAWTGVGPTLSRDGRWLAYVSSDSGQPEVYVTSFPTPGARVPVSTEGGNVPRWSSDGRRLYFLHGSRIMVVDVDIETAAENFVAGVPQLVAEADVIDFDVTPDGRIIAIWPEGSRGWDRLHVVLNWFQELDELVPVE